MDRTFVIVTYCLAESFCFLIPATIIFNRFLKLDSTPTCSSKRIISEIIAFVAAEVLVCFFIIYYECQQPESGRTSIQPVAWLLASTLLIGLSTEVCNLLCSRIKESHWWFTDLQLVDALLWACARFSAILQAVVHVCYGLLHYHHPFDTQRWSLVAVVHKIPALRTSISSLRKLSRSFRLCQLPNLSDMEIYTLK